MAEKVDNVEPRGESADFHVLFSPYCKLSKRIYKVQDLMLKNFSTQKS